MKRTLLDILSKIPKVQYADVRIVEQKSENLATKDGVVEAMSSSTSLGYGIRVLKDGVWGFAASYDFSSGGIDRTIKRAIAIAEASLPYKINDVILAPQKPIKASYKTPIIEDPFKVSMAEKVKILLSADKSQRVSKKIVISQSSYSAHKELKHFANTEGSVIDQEIIYTGAGIEASSANDHDFQNRSYPNSHGGQFATMGFELVRDLRLADHGAEIGQQAVELLTAPVCPTGVFDLILDGNQLGLQIHESCGHATELDRVYGFEASYAGTSFLTVDKLNKLQYGSSIVNLTEDATLPTGLGTFGYDDEGVPAERNYLIKNGILRDYLTSRETAYKLKNQVIGYHGRSAGTMRADSWSHIPMIRMTNVNLEPGGYNGSGRAWTLDELIADTKYGIFMSTNRSWSIDDKRLNFQFGTEIGWEIKNGKITRMLKNPTYQGMTPQFWNSCDAICGRNEWKIWGTPNCGKGQPSQVIYTGHGASPTRFRKVKIGVVKF